jgi:hypothetical protein
MKNLCFVCIIQSYHYSYVRWSFGRARFLLDLDNIRNPVRIDPSRLLDRISVPYFELDDTFIYPDQMTKENPPINGPRKREPIPRLSEFAISSAAYNQATAGTCPLCSHSEEEKVSKGEESDSN